MYSKIFNLLNWRPFEVSLLNLVGKIICCKIVFFSQILKISFPLLLCSLHMWNIIRIVHEPGAMKSHMAKTTKTYSSSAKRIQYLVLLVYRHEVLYITYWTYVSNWWNFSVKWAILYFVTHLRWDNAIKSWLCRSKHMPCGFISTIDITPQIQYTCTPKVFDKCFTSFMF